MSVRLPAVSRFLGHHLSRRNCSSIAPPHRTSCPDIPWALPRVSALATRSTSRICFSTAGRRIARSTTPKNQNHGQNHHFNSYRSYYQGRTPPRGPRIIYTNEPHPPHPPRRPPLQEAWATKPGFRYTVYTLIGAGGIFYVSNLEKVPMSGRRRFNCVSSEMEAEMAKEGYKQVILQYRGHFVSPYSRASARVKRVADRLIAVSGLDDLDWEVHLIHNPTPNAFVLPGGKIFVFTGILGLAKTDSQLAAVLSHEIAHTLAHHMAERLSSYYLVFGTIWSVCLLLGIHVGIGNVLADLAIMKPASRKQETEADYIGLRILAQACYEPEGALEFWANMRRMEEFRGVDGDIGFLSTHPGTEDRIRKIQEWLPEANEVRSMSDCSQTDSMADEFRRAFGAWRW